MTVNELKAKIEKKYELSDKALVAGKSELAEKYEQQALDLARELTRLLEELSK